MGPLHGLRVIELAGIGPGPFCAMLLGDLGADVVRIDRTSGAAGALPGPLASIAGRSRRSIAVDLKHPDGLELVLDLAAGADVLIEGFRPGVAERLGIGPEACHERNPRLVYGRMTGWGREGDLAATAGHDIDYIALTGALHAIGRPGARPVPPLNLVGDYGGGALYLAFGVLAALVARARTGRGDVIDAAMIDGAASLMSPFSSLLAAGFWSDRRGSNLLDGGAPFYDTYQTADDRYVAVGALEPQFFAELVAGLGLDPASIGQQYDTAAWPAMREQFAAAFRACTRDEWAAHFATTDACVAPVLSLEEAPHHPHHQRRGTYIEVDGRIEPAPAPRFASSTLDTPQRPPHPGEHTDEILRELGRSGDDIARLRGSGAVG